MPLIIGVRETLTPGEFAEEVLLDGALNGALDVSTPRAPFDYHFSRDEVARGGALDWRETEEQKERVWVDDDEVAPSSYDSDGTLPIEGEYAYEAEEDAAAQRLLRAPAAPRESEKGAPKRRRRARWSRRTIRRRWR